MKTRTKIIIALVVVLLVAGGAGVWWYFGSRPSQQPVLVENGNAETVMNVGTPNLNAPEETVNVVVEPNSNIPENAVEPATELAPVENDNIFRPTNAPDVREEVAEVGPESRARNERLDQLDREQILTTAVDVLNMLRNFNYTDYASSAAWQSRFLEKADLAKAAEYPEKNILYQETLPGWASACATYPEYWSAVKELRVLNVYMDEVDSVYTPAVGIVTVEEQNEDYPYPGSEHWKPIDRVEKTYIVYLTEDGSRVYNVKVMKTVVLEKNIYGHWYNPESSHQREENEHF